MSITFGPIFAMYNLLYLALSLSVVSLSIVISYFYLENSYSCATVEPNTMANNVLIFVSSATKVHSICQKASMLVQKVLYVKINENTAGILPVISRQIVNLYSRASAQCGSLDIRLILRSGDAMKIVNTNYPVDLILYDKDLSSEADKLKESVVTQTKGCNVQCVDSLESLESTGKEEPVKTYEYVALGGTFDRLHNGHKILLSQAVLRATKHVTVGVTDVNMIKSKKLWELIEPIDQRIKAVLNFLTDINPDLEYNVLPIQDMYGPTKDDARIQLLVLSEETVRGGVKVNEKRIENGLPALSTHVIELAPDYCDRRTHEEEAKLSSSNQRMRMLGTLLRPPMPNPNIPEWPYVIGLAGGIASGKSNIAEKLKAKGAAIVNCDLIAHELYKPGLPLNATIAETFGAHVITASGEVDRKALGQIVFGDKTQLEKLNQVLWPAIIAEAQHRIKVLGDEGHRVVVMEAAVMVRARWYSFCHQLWAVIIPPEEAVKRLQKRNNLTEEEARQRIQSQPSNLEQVALANIVFSPYWSYEYTQGQVDRAWAQLQRHLDARKSML